MGFLLGIVVTLSIYSYHVRNYTKDYMDNTNVVKLDLITTLHPFLVFDEDLNVIDSHAYKQFIKKISFEGKDKFVQPKIIIVETKQWLQTAPNVRCLSLGCYAKPISGDGKIWKYSLNLEELRTFRGPMPKLIFQLDILK